MKKLSFKLIVIGVNALLLIAVTLCIFQINSHARTLQSQRAEQAWRGQNEMRFAQASAFLPASSLADEYTVMGFRAGLESALIAAGVETTDEEGLWTDAYSGTGTLQVAGDKGAYSATAIGVAGDFFLFHPYELLSGGYISDNDLMKDRVVLDQDLAWKLFGASDLAGMSVTIGGKPYYIAGVISREADIFSEKAFGTTDPLIFMPYSTASENIGDFGISCYEIVMADPISDFVLNTLTERFMPNTAVTVQNTDRYSFGRIYDMFQDFGDRAISSTGVAYPYWENAARVSEDYIARLYVYTAIFGALPLLMLIWLCVRLIKLINRKIKQGWARGKDAWDDRYARIDDLKNRTPKPRKRKKHPDKAPLPKPPSYDEEAITLDIETIVREIMDDHK